MLPIHEHLSKFDLNNIQLDFDATNLYLSAMWVEMPVYPKIETGFAFKPHLNNVYAEVFNNQISNHDGNESAIFQKKNYNKPNLIIQHLSVNEKVEKNRS